MADADLVYELTTKVESNIDVDKKIAALHGLQSELENGGYVVEADAVTSAIKTALKHSNQALSNASLAFVPTYASLIYSGDGTESHSILNHNVRVLVNSVTSLVIEKLGDQKERIRESARTALIELGNAAYALSSGHLTTSGKGKETETPLGIFERTIRDAGLAAKFARIREQTVLLLPILRQNCEKYPVKPLLPITVDLLSDADATVREGARSTLVSLFSNATQAAKGDLKKEMEKRGVRKQTADAIIREVLAAPSANAATVHSPAPMAPTVSSGNGVHSRTASSFTSGGEDMAFSQSKASNSTATTTSSTTSAAASAAADDIRPVYIASKSDLERTFAAMLPFYEGRESEHNWLNREQSMIKIRGMIVSGVHRQFGESTFVGHIKIVQEGILKCVASLRTTLCQHAIHLVQELAIELGDDLAPCVEAFLTALTAMAGFTKKIVASAAQEAAAAIMVNVSYRPLYLQLISHGYQDKNVATRTWAAEHLCTVLSHHAAHRKHAVEGHGGLDIMEKCLRKGASDSNPAARSKSREAFWIFHQYWPEQANAILNSLDASTKKQVMATAPAHVGVDAMVEQKPKAAVPARVRPGGASSAILQAKKAAAMKIAQERERKKAEEAAAAHEARLAAARAAHEAEQQRYQTQYEQHAASFTPEAPEREEYSTPVPAARKAGGFMPVRNRSQQQHHSEAPPPILISPNTRQRVEVAASIPLPTSPTLSSSTGSMLDTPRAQKSSTLSQPSSNSSNPRSPGQSPVESRGRAISSSSYSSHGSSPASNSTPSGRRPTAPALASNDPDVPSLEDLTLHADDGFDGEDTGDTTTQPRFSSNVNPEDETLQLAAPEDASMDLMGMNFSSPFRMPAADLSSRPSNMKRGQSSDTTASLFFTQESTPRGAGPFSGRSEQDPLTPRNGRNGSARTASSSSSVSSPGASARRSGLPRPVSMIHSPSSGLASSPSSSPLGHFSRSTSQRTLSSSTNGSASTASSAASARGATGTGTTTAAANAPSTAQTSPTAKSSTLPAAPSKAASVEMAASSSSSTSSAASSWMSNKASRLEGRSTVASHAAPTLSLKSRPEVQAWITALVEGTADLRVFRKVAKLSSEFKVDDAEFAQNVQAEACPPSSFKTSNTGLQSSDFGASSMMGLGSGTQAWMQDGLFDRLFNGLIRYLQGGEGVTAELQLSAQVLLHRLIENQYPLFPATGNERRMLEILFSTIIASNSTSTNTNSNNDNSTANSTGLIARKTSLQATESILSSWAQKVDPVLGFDQLKMCLDQTTPSSNNAATTMLTNLALKSGFTPLLLRLPPELILDDFLPRLRDMLIGALKSPNQDARIVATTMLTKVNHHLRSSASTANTQDLTPNADERKADQGSHRKIFQILQLDDQTDRGTMDLLMYYFSKK